MKKSVCCGDFLMSQWTRDYQDLTCNQIATSPKPVPLPDVTTATKEYRCMCKTRELLKIKLIIYILYSKRRRLDQTKLLLICTIFGLHFIVPCKFWRVIYKWSFLNRIKILNNAVFCLRVENACKRTILLDWLFQWLLLLQPSLWCYVCKTVPFFSRGNKSGH